MNAPQDLEGVPVSDLCEELGIHATQCSSWEKQPLENGAVAFERRPNQANQRRQEDAREKKIAQLEEKVQRKNEVVAELLEEHVQLKKPLWKPERELRSPGCSRQLGRLRGPLAATGRSAREADPAMVECS